MKAVTEAILPLLLENVTIKPKTGAITELGFPLSLRFCCCPANNGSVVPLIYLFTAEASHFPIFRPYRKQEAAGPY